MTPTNPEQLASAWFDGWKVKNAAAIERMMGAEYVYVAPNGAVMSRDAILAIIRDPSYAITEGGHTDVVVTCLGSDVVLVRHHWRGRGTLRGQQFVDDHRCVMVWHRVAGEWRVQYEQASPIAP
jgi:ketosteroid isomerase-like protein